MTNAVKKGYRVEKACPICGKKFIPKKWGDRGFQKYCSRPCKDEAWKKPVKVICIECGKEFVVKKSWAEGRKFCSKKCDGHYRSKTQKGKNNPAWKGGISNDTLGKGKNPSRKGTYYENLARKELESKGYYVIRSAASKGIWDLVAVNDMHILFVQSKVRRMPRIHEREAMEEFICPDNSIKQIWRFFGYGKKEILTWSNKEGWIKEYYE